MKLPIIFLALVLVLSACTPAAPLQPEAEKPVVQEVALTQTLLADNYWLGESSGLDFDADQTVRMEIRAETDCLLSGAYSIENDKVLIDITMCNGSTEGFEQKSLVLTLGEGTDDMLFSQYLESEEGTRFYNTNSPYKAGTELTFTQDGKTYTLSSIDRDPLATRDVVLYSEPSLNSPYYKLVGYDGSNDSFSLVSYDTYRSFIGTLTNEDGTWYLVGSIRMVFGDLKLVTNGKEAKSEDYSLPYTWVHESHIQ